MTEDGPRILANLKESQNVTICMIRVEDTPPLTSEVWWKKYINSSATVTVKKADPRAHPVHYVKCLACHTVDEVHVFLVSMPSKIFRKILKRVRWRAFAELETVCFEAAFT